MDINAVLDGIVGAHMDKVATDMGYDPKSPRILWQLTQDYTDATNPINASQKAYGFEGLNVGQIMEHSDNKGRVEKLLNYYGKKYQQVQKDTTK